MSAIKNNMAAAIAMAVLIFPHTAKLHAAEKHGYSPLHKLKYASNFKHFDYVNPEAPKGGKIRIGRRGTFNSLNFLKYPGRTPSSRTGIPINLTQYLYDSLLVPSADETAGYYGLLAKTVEVENNFNSVTFTLRKDAKWHDGKSITAADVKFTFDTLTKQGAPFYIQTLRPIKVKTDGDNKVTFTPTRPGDRDLIRIVGSIPIHPKHYWEQNNVGKTTMKIPLASGPYKITTVNPGQSVRLERVPQYWAANHPVNTGRYNFDQINLEYYLDENSALTAFKAGRVDIRVESNPLLWVSAYKGKALSSGEFRRTVYSTNTPGMTVRLVFNVRRKILQDRDVRKALAILYDFPTLNKTLFHSMFNPVTSVYGDTPLAATGKSGAQETALLTPFTNTLPKEILDKPSPDWRTNLPSARKALKIASDLLDKAGLKLKDGKRIIPSTGDPIKLSVAFTNPGHQRVLAAYAARLKRIGVELDITVLPPLAASQKLLNHNYDLAVIRSLPEIIAGPREALLWGSRHADRQKSYAFAGVKNPAIDHLIRKMRSADNLEDMQTAARAFDRVMRWQIYDIPLWRKSDQWVAYWNKYGQPEISPGYHLTFIDRWWSMPHTH